ncbi:MSCRAMM family protein [Mariniblastus fucicola]|uniref:Serine-aspartate repeat-containing protein F n=1 Tax=Mariniblastus fucicola TaxID=980251 RepID=A0A5B9P9D7_9BACT|nr:SdrD B-like domain-containing protein [Mariniblastus fucicola]QEG22964.1 Serine-aspartate repeat-containing protein F precursor [Mariniblastus fucicola]
MPSKKRKNLFSRWTKYFDHEVSPDRRKRTQQRIDAQSYASLEPRQVLTSPLPSFPVDSGLLYQIHGVEGNQGQLSEIDLTSRALNDVGDNAGFQINATAFRSDDGFIYGLRRDSNELVRIGANGASETLGNISGFPSSGSYSGDFAEDGLLYMRNGSSFYGINVETLSVDNVVTANENVSRTYDIAYNPKTGLHYSIRKAGTRSEFISIDLRSGENEGQVIVINDNLEPAGTYGALFSDASGRVVAGNNRGGLYEIDLETGAATFAGYSPRASSNDGAFSALGSLNLPPVVTDAWMSILESDSQRQIPIETPYDLEGQELKVTVTRLPSIGTIVDGAGTEIATGQTMTVDQLTSLTFKTPDQFDSAADPVSFEYEVSDGSLTSTGKVDINFAGLSRVEGSVVVLDNSEESSYAGYVYNNEITLTGEDFRGNQVKQTVLTDVNGNFSFEDLAPGKYQIQQDQPYVVFDSHVVAEAENVTLGENLVSGLIVSEMPQSISGITFYEHAPSLISGFTYVDADGNGSVGFTETGVAAVAIKLEGKNFEGAKVELKTTTDSYGFYEFRGLASGTYTVTQSQPNDYISGESNAGEYGGKTADNMIASIELGSGEKGLGYNFGEYENSSLSGSVFIDNDLDAANDMGDTPLEGVTVRLSGTDFRGIEVSEVTTTDANGNYRFDRLLAGTYSLTQDQPEGLEEGFSHVGIFNDDETVLSTNGTRSKNRIDGIEVGFGRDGRSFDFSERTDYNFVGEFEQTIVFTGTDESDVFVFNAGTTHHYAELNGESHYIDASKNTNIVFEGKLGDDRVYMTGSTKVERVITTETSAVMRSETFRVQAIDTSWFVIDSGGGFDKVIMYDTPEVDRIKMTQDYSRLWNSEGYFAETRGYHRSYFFADNGGDDRAYLYDSKYEDTIKMTPSNARMISRKYYSFARNVERVYAYSVNGGSDRSQFWDSHQDQDVFQAKPEYARMYNDGFYNIAQGFAQSDAFAHNTGENDRAYLFGSEGDDMLVSSPAKTGITGEGFAIDVHGFERTYGISNGGNDRALLIDSKMDDRFVARPDEATLYNEDYFLKASGFAKVDAWSSQGGNDRAYFYDSAGDETLVALDNEVRMYGERFDNNSHGFARAYSHSTAGGNDSAILFDTAQADTIKLGDDVSKMYGETYYTWLNQFENVKTKFTSANRHDRAIVFGSIDTDALAASGELGELIQDHAMDFIYDPNADASGDSDDSDLAAIFAELTGA